MSRTSTGKAYEKEAREILESQGWLVEKAINKTIFLGPGKIISVAHDFFHCFDLIAKKLGEKTRWIQVSVWEKASQKRKDLASFPATLAYDSVEIWGRVRRGGKPHFRVLKADQDFEWKGDVEMVLRKEKKAA